MILNSSANFVKPAYLVKNQIDKILLISYISGDATPEQKRQIELWLDSDSAHWDFFYQCLEEWERNHQKVDFNEDADFGKLTKRIYTSERSGNKAQEEKDGNIAFSSVEHKAGQPTKYFAYRRKQVYPCYRNFTQCLLIYCRKTPGL